MSMMQQSSSDSTETTPNPPRIPKLHVRNRIEGLSPPSPVCDDDEINPINSLLAPISHSRFTFPSRPSDDSLSPKRPGISPVTSDRRPSSNISTTDSSSDVTIPQTKKRSVFSFLTVKEPTTSAWKSFAEEQKAQAATKGPKAVSLVEKKLPSSVPKVNSKWDGMPNIAHERSKSNHDFGSFGRPSTSRQSRRSNWRPGSSTSTAKSSTRSSDDSRSGMTSRASNRPSTVHRTHRSSDDTVRRKPGPAMSVATFDRTRPPSPEASDEERPPPFGEGISEMFLFFPPERTPRDTPRDTPTAIPYAARISYFPDFSPPENDTPTPKATTPLPMTPTLETSTFEKITEQSLEVPNMQDDSQSGSNSPNIPHTPPDEFAEPPSRLKIRPGPLPRHFKSVNEIPQWPLATNPEDVIVESHTSADAAEFDRTTSPVEQLRTSGDGSFDFFSAGGLFSPSSVPLPGSPAVIASTNGPSHAEGATPATPANSPSRNRSGFHPMGLRAPPAFLPGRVVTKDSDLWTIPESDTASLRSARDSLLLSPASAAKTQDTDSASMAESLANSELSAQWYLSPQERLGLGSLLKHTIKTTPWPLVEGVGAGSVEHQLAIKGGVANGNGGLRPVSPWDDRKASGKKLGITSVFKREW